MRRRRRSSKWIIDFRSLGTRHLQAAAAAARQAYKGCESIAAASRATREREREREFTDSSVRRRCRSEVSRRLQRRSLSFSPSPCVQVRAAANHLARLRCRRRQQCVCDSHGSPQVNSPPEPNRTDSPPAASEHKQKRKQKKKEASAVLAKQSATVFGAALSAACDRWESLQAKAS